MLYTTVQIAVRNRRRNGRVVNGSDISPLVIATLLAACAGPAAPAEAPATEPAPSEQDIDPNLSDAEEWSGLVDGEYSASHGWGHVYRCRVRGTSEGSAPSEEFFLNVAVGDDWLPDDEQTPMRGMRMTFRRSDRPYGPPSGYRDPTNRVYWVLISATLSQ